MAAQQRVTIKHTVDRGSEACLIYEPLNVQDPLHLVEHEPGHDGVDHSERDEEKESRLYQ
jgi:hypothetical protein